MNNTVNEKWKPVICLPNYEVSNLGRIRNVKTQRILHPFLTHNGYHRLNLCKNGSIKKYVVHRLIAEAFIGPKPDGYEINHKDYKRTNNCADNLEWVTSLQNKHHAMINGAYRGVNNGHAKLTENQVKEIRQLTKNKIFTQKEIALKFHVSDSLINMIYLRQKWKHI